MSDDKNRPDPVVQAPTLRRKPPPPIGPPPFLPVMLACPPRKEADPKEDKRC